METTHQSSPEVAMSLAVARTARRSGLARREVTRGSDEFVPRQARPVREAPEDEDIRNVEEFLAGRDSAFEELFEKYREKVYAIAYRFVRHREDALEVTQDVFLRVYLGLENFKTDSRFFTWLYRIAVNRAIDFTRRRRRLPISGSSSALIESREEAAASDDTNPVKVAQTRELEHRLAQAVDELSPKHRAVFVLHASENLTYREIAEVLDCNIGTVMSRLFYARKKLQRKLAGFGHRRLSDERNGRREESNGRKR